MNPLVVRSLTACQDARAKQLAMDLSVPLVDIGEANITLCVAAQGLALQFSGQKPIAPDFQWERWKKRRQEGGKQALIKACKPKPGMRIIDATAGWGRDSALLASFGAQVLMLERSAVMHCLLQDALERQDDSAKQHLTMTVLKADAIAYLSQCSKEKAPDLIYLDPMHPEREKSASVKQDLQLLQALIGEDQDVVQLLIQARRVARSKVVLKWPAKKPFLVEPHYCIKGKTIQYGCYLPE